jgi:hypothetical protein
MDRFFVTRASYELVASVAPTAVSGPRWTTDARRELERLVALWLGDSFRALWTTTDEVGRLHVAVLYAPPASVVTWPASASSPVRTIAPSLLADVARLDPAEHRLLLTLAREPHLAPLAGALGGAVHGDPAYYGLRPSFSFKTLQALGAAGFARLPKPPGVRAWSIVGCQWDSGREERIESRSDDALASLEARTQMDGGYFPRLTLRIEPDVARGRADLVDLFLQLPHRITVSDPRHEGLARLAGRALRFFEPGVLPDDVRTLAPWVHFEWRWREVLGDDAFELLVRERILSRVKAKKGVATPEHRWLGSSVKLTPVPGEGVCYATPLDFALPAFDVEEAEAHAFRLDESALARRMGAVMGLRAGVASVPGALALGALVVKSGRAHVYYAAARPPAGLVAAVRAACKLGATPVLCVPRGRRLPDEGIAQVELDLHEQLGVAATTSLVTGRVAVALGIEDQIDAWRLAEADEVLVVHRKGKRVWLLGVELTHLLEGTFRMLERLAIERGAVEVRVLGAYVSNASDPDVVVRKRRARLVVQVQRSFAAAGAVLPAGLADELVVIDGRGAYRLGVGCKVI